MYRELKLCTPNQPETAVLPKTLHGGTNNHGKTDTTITITTVVVKAISVEDEQQYRQQ
jgi:hypothetical protein